MDGMKTFRETPWADVKPGDVILVPIGDEITEVTVKQINTKPLMENGPMIVFVHYALRYAQYRVTFKPNETVYTDRKEETL